jgi:hypothetical protein
MYSRNGFSMHDRHFSMWPSYGLPTNAVMTANIYNEENNSTHKTDAKWIRSLDVNPENYNCTSQLFARRCFYDLPRAKGLNLRRITDGVPK